MSELGTVYKSERGYEIAGFEWALGWPLSFNSQEIAQGSAHVIKKGYDETTKPLLETIESQRLEIEKLNQALEDFRQIMNIPPSNLVMSTQMPKIIREMKEAIGATYKRYKSPAPEKEAASEYGFRVGDKVVSSAGGIGIIQAFLPDGYVRTSSFVALEIDLHPYEESEAPKPKFSVGDKVRIVTMLGGYSDKGYDTVTGYSQGNYSLCYFDDEPHMNHAFSWHEKTLVPYTE